MADIKFQGKTLITPRGEALWCKVTEADRKFNAKGEYKTDLLLDPSDANVAKFLKDLQAQLEADAELMRGELKPPKNKTLRLRDMYKLDYDADGNETGLIKMSFAMKNVDDRKPGENKIKVYDGKASVIHQVPLVGNGSIIKVQAFFKSTYLPSDNSIGMSKYWSGLQIISLKEFGGDSGFKAEDDSDFEATESQTAQQFTADEDDLDF